VVFKKTILNKERYRKEEETLKLISWKLWLSGRTVIVI